jgi:hypothetical protein
MGSIFKPKMPAPPVFIQPDPEKVPEMDSAEDKAILAEEDEEDDESEVEQTQVVGEEETLE